MKKYFSKSAITMITIITLSTIIACSSGGGSSPPPEGQRVIGVSGGTVEGPININRTKIEVPDGALEEETTITITENLTPPEIEEDMISVGHAVELGPHKTKFKTAVTVTIPYLDEDDDGILDGTNIPEENINPTVYNEEIGEWLRKKVISQDTINNTVTFETNHFSIYQAQTYHKESDIATKPVIMTIDGLDIKKTLLFDFTGQRESYLKRALFEGMELDQKDVEIVSYAGFKKLLFFIILPGKTIPIYSTGNSWSGDANTTADILEDLIVRVSQEYQYAKRGGKKFILMGHSWGTTLLELAKMYATDSNGEQINPDLVLTLSAPRGSEKVSYDENHLFVEKELSLDKEIFIRSAILIDMEEETPDPTSNDIDIITWSVSDAETHIATYAQEWIAYCQKQQQDKGISPNLVPAKTHINYYSKGDIISGPLAGIMYPSVQDREVDNQDLSERRNAESMEIFHAITSLDDGPDGAWQEFLSDPTILNAAIAFRETVKCDIQTALNLPITATTCYKDSTKTPTSPEPTPQPPTIDDIPEPTEPPIDPTTRFTDMQDGTVRDNDSGLIWLKNAGEFGYMSWNQATNEIAALNSGEHELTDGSIEGDWRLPTTDEWETLVDRNYIGPAICNTIGNGRWKEGDIFTGITYAASNCHGNCTGVNRPKYWSSTEYNNTAGSITLYNGSINNVFVKASNGIRVWPVRDPK